MKRKRLVLVDPRVTALKHTIMELSALQVLYLPGLKARTEKRDVPTDVTMVRRDSVLDAIDAAFKKR